MEIAAPAERVWALLTDFAAFPSWNPFIRRAEGRLEPGAPLRVRLRLFRGRSVTMGTHITRVEPGRELRWLARLGLPGVLDVERRFVIEPDGPGRVRFVQSEVCSGVLTPLLGLGLEARILGGYHALERAIKQRAEAG